MHPHDKREPGREPIPIDAHGGDWIKGDRIRVGDDGALYVPDPTAPSGTRRIDPGHRQVRVEYGGRSANVDEEIAPLIRELWRLGFDTISSCQHLEGTPDAFVGFRTLAEAERFAAMIAPRGTLLVPEEQDYAAASKASYDEGYSVPGGAGVAFGHLEIGDVVEAARRGLAYRGEES